MSCSAAGLDDALHVLFKLDPGDHDGMLAAQAFDTDVSPGPQYLPELAAAWMRLFHFNGIAHLELLDFHQTTS